MNEWNDVMEITANAKCQRCGRYYGPDNVTVERRADLLHFVMYCSFCDNIVSADLPRKKESINNVRL